MAKKVQGIVSLIIGAGQAELCEALSPALGAFGVNVEAFIKGFNAATIEWPAGTLLRTTITVYDDYSYTFTAVPML
ncbi:MAG: hypothetical protein Q8Q73_18715 [Stagnimonas sp.]|nr:hypothetical protein [Stagnimonas sp.]